MAGSIGGVVTAPINKEGMNLAGFHYPGHTELLADLTASAEVGMMIVGGPLKIMFTTTHVAIRNLPDTLTTERIVNAIRLAHLGLRDYFGVAQPKIGMAALNPHAGEHGLFGDEEQAKIQPAVDRARASGWTSVIRCRPTRYSGKLRAGSSTAWSPCIMTRD